VDNELIGELGISYVRAVAVGAGDFVEASGRHLDGDGVDLTLLCRGTGGVTRSPRLDLQVKATTRGHDEDPLCIDLSLKNYDELRHEGYQVPRVLVVVEVPRDRASWVEVAPEQLVMRRCGYWASLRGHPDSENQSTVRVKIPRERRWDVEAVAGLMDRVQKGEL